MKTCTAWVGLFPKFLNIRNCSVNRWMIQFLEKRTSNVKSHCSWSFPAPLLFQRVLFMFQIPEIGYVTCRSKFPVITFTCGPVVCAEWLTFDRMHQMEEAIADNRNQTKHIHQKLRNHINSGKLPQPNIYRFGCSYACNVILAGLILLIYAKETDLVAVWALWLGSCPSVYRIFLFLYEIRHCSGTYVEAVSHASIMKQECWELIWRNSGFCKLK